MFLWLGKKRIENHWDNSKSQNGFDQSRSLLKFWILVNLDLYSSWHFANHTFEKYFLSEDFDRKYFQANRDLTDFPFVRRLAWYTNTWGKAEEGFQPHSEIQERTEMTRLGWLKLKFSILKILSKLWILSSGTLQKVETRFWFCWKTMTNSLVIEMIEGTWAQRWIWKKLSQNLTFSSLVFINKYFFWLF